MCDTVSPRFYPITSRKFLDHRQPSNAKKEGHMCDTVSPRFYPITSRKFLDHRQPTNAKKEGHMCDTVSPRLHSAHLRAKCSRFMTGFELLRS